MNLRLSLMMLLIMVSLTAVCQYPLTKKIGQQEVVIMTTKQAEDINNRFLRMKDSISLLKFNMQTQQVQHKVTVSQITDSLSKKQVDLRYKEGEANWYKKEYYQMQTDTYKYLGGIKTDMTVLVGIVAVLTALVTITLK